MIRACLIVSLFLPVLLPFPVAAQTPAQDPLAPAKLPELEPTTAPRREATLPPGFIRVEIEGRYFFLEPDDEEWVRNGVERAGSTTAPTTMPTDLLEQFRIKAAQIQQRIARDLALSDPKPVADFFDQRLRVFLERMDEYRPPIIYLVITRQRLEEVMREGWTDPRFYYNRAADDVSYRTHVNLSLTTRDDSLVPLLYDRQATIDARQQLLGREIHAVERDIMQAVSAETLTMVAVGFVELISGQALAGTALAPDQEWFAVGVAGVLAGFYTSELSGYDPQLLLDNMTRPAPGNPIRPSAIDLLHPTPVADLRPQAVGAYLDAYRRRAMQVVRHLIERVGVEAIPKILTALRQSPPSDGKGLIRLIEQATGVDLSAEIARR